MIENALSCYLTHCKLIHQKLLWYTIYCFLSYSKYGFFNIRKFLHACICIESLEHLNSFSSLSQKGIFIEHISLLTFLASFFSLCHLQWTSLERHKLNSPHIGLENLRYFNSILRLVILQQTANTTSSCTQSRI